MKQEIQSFVKNISSDFYGQRRGSKEGMYGSYQTMEHSLTGSPLENFNKTNSQTYDFSMRSISRGRAHTGNGRRKSRTRVSR
jgi:hypothetical protein